MAGSPDIDAYVTTLGGTPLPLRARIIAQGALSGLHRARTRGSSVEFAQHKEYTHGDELRHLDWKVYARADRYVVKQFEQESELTSHLIVDASASMAYRGAGPSKLDCGIHIAAALAHLLIHQRDRVGLYAFGDPRLDRLVPPRARPAHLRDVFGVLEDLAQQGARGDEPLSDALSRIAELSGRRRALIAVFSDLFDPTGKAIDVLRWLRARGHDVVVFHILDDHELELPFEGLTLFRSLESKAELLTNPSAIRKAYRRRLREFLERAEADLTSGGVDYRVVPTSADLSLVIRELLQRRLTAGGTR